MLDFYDNDECINEYFCDGCSNVLPEKDFYPLIKNMCRECHKERRKLHYHNNREKTIQINKIWGKNNPDKFRKSQNKYQKVYQKNRRKTDILFNLKGIIRSRTKDCFRYKSWKKENTFKEYIGCSLEQLKIHIENQFQTGMTWDNHGLHGWHIDHIVPLASAKTPEELYKLCHHTNLQPLWARDNIIKGNKIRNS